jgi:hypothetical protein
MKVLKRRYRILCLDYPIIELIEKDNQGIGETA